MKHWIIPADTKRYKLEEAIKQLHEIDWRQHNNYEVGDIIYIYCSKPISKVVYKMEVVNVNITKEYTIADKDFWANPTEFNESLKNNRFFRITLLKKNLTDKLTLEDLISHGLKSAPQGAIIVKEPLLEYLQASL